MITSALKDDDEGLLFRRQCFRLNAEIISERTRVTRTSFSFDNRNKVFSDKEFLVRDLIYLRNFCYLKPLVTKSFRVFWIIVRYNEQPTDQLIKHKKILSY